MSERRTRGELESAVLHALWDAREPLSAREILGRFGESEGVPALTTVLTVLDRLRAKGRVAKTASPGGGVLFEATESESRYTADAMLAALVGAADRSAALLRFAGDLDERDIAVLRRALAPREGASDRPQRSDRP